MLLEQTDEPANPEVLDEFTPAPPQRGLENNPGKDGHIFNDTHPYFPTDCRHCPFNKQGVSDTLLALFSNRKKDCHRCKFIKKSIEQINKENHIKANKVEYYRLLRDEHYTNVVFDKKSGGLKATHVGHITHDSPKAERFFEGLTSSDLERECQNQLVAMGHRAILCDESKRKKGNFLPALDLMINDVLMDIRSITSTGWYSNVFVKKNEQLRRFNGRTDIKLKSNTLCMYFHNKDLFDERNMQRSLHYIRFYRDKNGELLKRDLEHIICVIKGEKDIKSYDI